MSCRIHEEIDMGAYLLEPGAVEFDAFRAHYPSCPVCSEELRIWTALEQALSRPSPDSGGDAAPWHPDAAALARFSGSAHAAGPEDSTMQRHIDSCASCRTEWLALASFDFAETMDDPWRAAGDATASAATPGLIERLIGWFGLGNPARAAVAGALAVTAVVMVTWVTLGPEKSSTRDARSLAGRAAPETAVPSMAQPSVDSVQPAGVVDPVDPVDPAEPALAEATPPPVVEAPATDTAQLVQAEMGSPSGRAVPAIEGADDERESGDPRSMASVVGDEVLLASLSKMPPPVYAAPGGASELAWMHQFGSVRGASRGPGSAAVLAHAPDHVGFTREASPRLWWSVSEVAPQSVTITLVDDREIDPVLEVELPGPQAAGLASISLADHSVVLEPGVEYRWFVTLVVDAERPSRNQISAGSIKRVPLDAVAEKSFEAAPPARRGHALASQGYWYDSYDFFADLSTRHPGASVVGAHREHLLADVSTAR